jgi:NTE family protein
MAGFMMARAPIVTYGDGPSAMHFPIDDWEGRIAKPFRRFAGSNHRAGPLAHRFLPWNVWRHSASSDALATQLSRWVTRGATWADYPDFPKVRYGATDLCTGTYVSIGKDEVQFAYPWTMDLPTIPIGGISPAMAIAASSSFPPFFGPMSITARNPDKAAKDWRGVRLVDGGVYDNTAIESVWRHHDVILMSDGGGRITRKWDAIAWWSPIRFMEVTDQRGRELQRRWLLSTPHHGGKVGIWSTEQGRWRTEGSDLELSLDASYQDASEALSQMTEGLREIAVAFGSEPALSTDPDTSRAGSERRYTFTVSQRLAELRTDLDAFSELEISVLENHGYIESDLVLQRLIEAGVVEVKRPDAPFSLPHPDFSPDELRPEASDQLATGSVRSRLGRWRG